MTVFGLRIKNAIPGVPSASALYQRTRRDQKRPEVEARWAAKRAAVDYDALRVTWVTVSVSRPERERVRAWATAQGLSMAEACRRVIFAALDTPRLTG